jgi:hypothetical protein
MTEEQRPGPAVHRHGSQHGLISAQEIRKRRQLRTVGQMIQMRRKGNIFNQTKQLPEPLVTHGRHMTTQVAGQRFAWEC